MLRNGLQCAFDPAVFINIVNKIMAGRARFIGDASLFAMSPERYYLYYLSSDMNQIFPDKCWVNTFYELEEQGFNTRFAVKIKSLQHGTCVMKFSLLLMNSNTMADILYDEFGMVPNGTGFDTELWLNLKFKDISESRDINLLVRIVEDKCLERVLTMKLLKEFLNNSIENEWSEGTMVILRAIHDRDGGKTDNAETMRL